MRFAMLLVMLPIAHAQSPQEVLQRTAENYRSLDGYEFGAHVTTEFPGSSWRIKTDITIFAPMRRSSPSNQSRTAPSEIIHIGNFHAVDTGNRKDEKIPEVGFPPQVLAGFAKIAQDVVSVERTGSEELLLNGNYVPCEILKVTYSPSTYENPHPQAATYWISPTKNLILKKTLVFSASRRSDAAPATWTITIDSAHFKRPPPQWVLEMPHITGVKVRKEWIGRPAPDFALPSLEGAQVRLSSLRGKVVLLDFLSITCGPCLIEMPTIEALGRGYHGREVDLWSITFDPADIVRKWLMQHHHSLPTISDPDFHVSDLYKVEGIPTIVLIGRDGKVKSYWVGEVSKDVIEVALNREVQR